MATDLHSTYRKQSQVDSIFLDICIDIEIDTINHEAGSIGKAWEMKREIGETTGNDFVTNMIDDRSLRSEIITGHRDANFDQIST